MKYNVTTSILAVGAFALATGFVTQADAAYAYNSVLATFGAPTPTTHDCVFVNSRPSQPYSVVSMGGMQGCPSVGTPGFWDVPLQLNAGSNSTVNAYATFYQRTSNTVEARLLVLHGDGTYLGGTAFKTSSSTGLVEKYLGAASVPYYGSAIGQFQIPADSNTTDPNRGYSFRTYYAY